MLNMVIMQGRLVKDPELKATTSGKDVCTFAIAVQNGKDSKVDFFNVIAFSKTGELVKKYFRKGALILIRGTGHIDTFEAKDGSKRQAFKIIADAVEFCGSKEESDTTVAKDVAMEIEEIADEELPF